MTNNSFRGEDLESLFKYGTIRHDKCVACGSICYEDWTYSGSYVAVKCDECGLIWMNPSLNEEGLNRYYRDYIGKRRINNELKMQQREIQYKKDAHFIEKYIDDGKVLDVGCSGGFFLATLSSNFEKYGIEIDSEAVKYAKENQKEFGGNIQCSTIDENFTKEKFDLVIMRGAIEHFIDPVHSIRRVSELLRSGGYYYITATPNGNSFSADLYRDKWTLFHPIQHIWYFSPDTLSLICERFGLELVAQEFPYIGTPYENARQDIKRVAADINFIENGNSDKVNISPAFWDNMMSLVFKKKR